MTRNETILSLGQVGTRSGKLFRPLHPDPALLDIEDIAWSLSHQCRFAGHTSRHYSVGEHSVYVSLLCGHELALEGLLHDGTEAYMVDVPKPLKGHLVGYSEIEDKLAACIAGHFGFWKPGQTDYAERVHIADRQMLDLEMQMFMPKAYTYWDFEAPPIPDRMRNLLIDLMRQGFTSKDVYDMFLRRFRLITSPHWANLGAE